MSTWTVRRLFSVKEVRSSPHLTHDSPHDCCAGHLHEYMVVSSFGMLA